MLRRSNPKVVEWDPVAEEWTVRISVLPKLPSSSSPSHHHHHHRYPCQNLYHRHTIIILTVDQVALYMMSARGNHAVAEVPFELISSFCHAI